jgi:hypothetical protein
MKVETPSTPLSHTHEPEQGRSVTGALLSTLACASARVGICPIKWACFVIGVLA